MRQMSHFAEREPSLLLPRYEVLISDPSYLDKPIVINKDITIVGGQWPHTDTATTILINRNIVVDPGTIQGLPRMLNNIADSGARVADIAYILTTHADADHIEAAQALKDEVKRLKGSAKLLVPKGVKPILASMDLLQMAGPVYNKDILPVIIPDKEILPGQVPYVDTQLTAINTPGHVEPHYSYLVYNILIAGDVYGALIPGRSNLAQMRDSMAKLLDYQFDWVIESHTDPRIKPMITRDEFIQICNNLAITNGDLHPIMNGKMWSPRN